MYEVSVLSEMSSGSKVRCVVCFRAAGAWGVSRAVTNLGPGLRPLPASSARPPGALLCPVPLGFPECTGLRVALHILVT